MEDDYEKRRPPIVLDYGRSKPLGYKATQKLTRFFPITSLPNTDLVRFIINSNGYWDPYSSYLRFTVRVKTDYAINATNDTPLGAVQLDNSASSLIQTMSFIQNGVEIERIDRYEVLASILNDMFFSKEQRIQRTHQGFGSGIGDKLTGRNGTNYKYYSSGAIDLASQVAAFSSSAATGCLSGVTPMSEPTVVAPPGANFGMSGEMKTPSPFFDGSGEPVMSGTKGTAGHITQMTFCIPILSGIFGVLMPADEIKYIPMQFFQNLEMNFRVNPYAFFSICPQTPGDRNFEIINCELFVNIIHFAPEINAAIADIVEERGMYLHTCSYYYGPSHMISANSSVETYPINMSFKSLRSILWCFIPSSYRQYNYIRELRRKALNITAAQVRIGGDLFPTFPIGNLGASSDSGLPWTNSDFLVNLYKSFGRLHDTVNDGLVTTHTFAEGNSLVPADYNFTPAALGDGKIWSSMVKGYSLANSTMLDMDGAQATRSYMNTATNNWLINQIVPRAVYGIDLDTITSDDSVLSGVNTLINKPFELLLEGRNNTTESCELNIFLYYDLVVMIDRDYTIKYLGRGG